MKNKALVIGLYVNGYGIIRELSRDSEIPIVGLDHNPKSFGFASKHLSEKYVLGNNESLIDFLLDYGKKQEYKVVLFPTTDYHTKIFARFYDELSQYYYIPVNPSTLLSIISKNSAFGKCCTLLAASNGSFKFRFGCIFIAGGYLISTPEA